MAYAQQGWLIVVAYAAAWLLALVIGLLLLYLVIRMAITNGMKAYKRWERSGER